MIIELFSLVPNNCDLLCKILSNNPFCFARTSDHLSIIFKIQLLKDYIIIYYYYYYYYCY